MKIELSSKQCEFINNATHRWNGKIGATQCGKTFIDVQYVVADRILERKYKNGLNLILGVTKETIERNVLEPMRDIWGDKLISEINSRNVAILFGEKVYCLGAEKVNQVSKLRGAKFKYVYCDELIEFNQEVFELLKSRLSLPYSVCDFTGNPSYPSHYVKKFIDSDADVYCQSWTIYDNPFLDPKVVRELEKEYEGTVYFDRYILGKWKQAEGSIYPLFLSNPDKYLWNKKLPSFMEVSVGLDFGGTKSGHAFVGTGTTANYQQLIAVKSKKYMNGDYSNGITSSILDKLAIDFVREILNMCGRCDYFEYDNENPVLGNSIKEAMSRVFPQVTVRPCLKLTIKERIELKNRLIGQARYFYTKDCETLKNATMEAVYDKNKLEDERLDDFTSDIDTLDGEEYTFTRNINRFIRR